MNVIIWILVAWMDALLSINFYNSILLVKFSLYKVNTWKMIQEHRKLRKSKQTQEEMRSRQFACIALTFP
ncbi:hypothetical protein L3i20_v205120 [Paenibacillus sp. L3-i20]|nr:hypothetical protein L3i20_v205120 [Paenibacillus sp. L3-i20]